MNKKILFFTFAFVALIATNKQSLAQDTASSAAPLGVEEILVTARKRSESIQDVPVAVTALSVEQVERGNIQRVQDLEKLAPNVEMYDMAFGGGGMSASIRGLSFDDLEKTFEPTVGTVIDGVFAASNSGTDLDLFDLDQLKFFVVLKELYLEEILLAVLFQLTELNQQESLVLNSKLI